MGRLTENGYVSSTPAELERRNLLAYRKNVTGWANNDASFNMHQLQSSTIHAAEIEQNIELVMNSMLLNPDNHILAEQHAELIGFKRKPAKAALVDCRFFIEDDALIGTLVPIDTAVSDISGSVIFRTINDGVINATKEVILQCQSEDDVTTVIPEGDINVMMDIIDGVSVVNINESIPATGIESIANLAARTRDASQAHRFNSKRLLRSSLLGVNGLTDNKIKIMDDFGHLKVIVDGGDNNEVAHAIFKCIGNDPTYTISEPSNNETERAKDIVVYEYADEYHIRFTRAKRSNVSLVINVVTELQMSDQIIFIAIKPVFDNFFATLAIGEAISRFTLENLVFDTIESQLSINRRQISSIVFNVTKDNIPIEFDSTTQKLPIAFDEILLLETLSVI